MNTPTFKVCTYHITFDDTVNNTTSNIYNDILNLTTKINKKYCELNNYSYSCDIFDGNTLPKFLDDEIFEIENKWDIACAYKYQYLLDQMETSNEDYIVYIEYDACFANDILRLENYVDDIHKIFYSRCNWIFDLQSYFSNVNKLVNLINNNMDNLYDYNKCTNTFFNTEIYTHLIRIK